MATKTATAEKKDSQTEQGDGPLLDKMNAEVKKMIAQFLEIELDNIALRLPTSDPGQVPAFLDDETTLRAAGTKPNDEIHLVVTL